MKKEVTTIPDLEIKANDGTWDNLKIWVKKKKVVFDVVVDEAGNFFEVDKEELKKLLK